MAQALMTAINGDAAAALNGGNPLADYAGGSTPVPARRPARSAFGDTQYNEFTTSGVFSATATESALGNDGLDTCVSRRGQNVDTSNAATALASRE